MEMMFPSTRSVRRATTAVATALLGAAAVLVPVGPAQAQPPPPPLRQVKYSVWAEKPFPVNIYYREVDPPNWAEYSHNPYVFSPKAEAQVGPDQQWVLDVQLANPDQWAMVTATSAPSSQSPNIHCVLAVDGVVVATDAGPKGALCSIRNW
jgi:hypothetical protein